MTVRENERNRLVTAVDFAAHCGSNNRHSFLYRRNYCLVGGTAAEPKPEDFCRRCNNTADGAATYGSRLLFTVFFWQQPLFGPAYLSDDRYKNSLQLVGNSAGSSGNFAAAHVPQCARCLVAG